MLRTKWVWKVKEGEARKLTHKARIVVLGYMQKFGLDFFETYAPVVRFETLRVVLLVAAVLRLEVRQYDFVTAFLNAKLGVRIYIEQPEGYRVRGKEDHVCLLLKSLYGLRQAPLEWNHALHELLLRMGFARCYKDYGLYVRRRGDKIALVTVYVDDILIIGTLSDIEKTQRELDNAFKLKAMGAVR